jgi:hypothetical protein
MRVELNYKDVRRILEQWAREHLPLHTGQSVDVITYQDISIFIEEAHEEDHKSQGSADTGSVKGYAAELGEEGLTNLLQASL